MIRKNRNLRPTDILGQDYMKATQFFTTKEFKKFMTDNALIHPSGASYILTYASKYYGWCEKVSRGKYHSLVYEGKS